MRLWAAQVAIVTIAALSCAVAAPARAASVNVTVKAKVVKPLTLRSIQDLDLGSILLGTGTWSGAVVRLTRDGVFTCPAQVSCSGATSVAQYNLQGSNNQPIIIRAPNVTMVNQSDPTKSLILVPDAPATITLPNSGRSGLNFPIGGSIDVDSTTADGTYVGTFEVTAEYQ